MGMLLWLNQQEWWYHGWLVVWNIFFFHPSHWLIFFRWVETINHMGYSWDFGVDLVVEIWGSNYWWGTPRDPVVDSIDVPGFIWWQCGEKKPGEKTDIDQAYGGYQSPFWDVSWLSYNISIHIHIYIPIHIHIHTYIYTYILWMNKWSQSCSCFLVTCAQPFIHVPWGSNSRRGNPQPLWLTGSSWWEGWGSAWSHRIEANPFWFAEDSILSVASLPLVLLLWKPSNIYHLGCLWKDLERFGGGEGEFLPVWSDSHW